MAAGEGISGFRRLRQRAALPPGGLSAGGLDRRCFLTALAEELQSGSGELAEFNARQHRMWHAHVGDLPYERINGIPCLILTDERSTVPFTLVTEFPDETIQGPAFQLAHTTQMRTVLAAAGLYWKGLLA